MHGYWYQVQFLQWWPTVFWGSISGWPPAVIVEIRVAALVFWGWCRFAWSTVGKPEKLSAACAAATLRDGVRAYTALHTHAGIAGGHTLLVIDGSSVSTIQSSAKVEKDSSELVSCFLQNFGLMCIQLAAYCGLKVLATSSSAEEQAFLEQLRPAVGVYSLYFFDPSMMHFTCYPYLFSRTSSGLQEPLVGEIFSVPSTSLVLDTNSIPAHLWMFPTRTPAEMCLISSKPVIVLS